MSVSLAVKEPQIDKQVTQYLVNDLFTQMNAAVKEKVRLTERLKNQMPVKLRDELQSELKNVHKKMNLLQLIWTNVVNANSSQKVQALLEELKEQNYASYPEAELDLTKYKKYLLKSDTQHLKRLYEDYRLFVSRLNYSQHLCSNQNKQEKKAYLETVYTVACYFGLDYKESIHALTQKLGVSGEIQKVTFEQVQKVCEAKWTLTASTIDCETRNIYLLGEALSIIPNLVDENIYLNGALLNSLQLSKKEIREIIAFTNLLKIDEIAATKPFLQIKKYEILKFLANQFKQYAYKEVDFNNRILVVGTMSSGKSTFLNSLIGQDLFPSKNEACTARIFEYSVKHNPNYIVYNGNQTETFDELSQEMVSEWNEVAGKEPLCITGPSKSALQIDKKLTFVDTPGPNNSADQTHRETMNKALTGDYDKILYLINSTQLGTEDDVILLNHVKDLLKNKGDLPVYFIVNKVDEFDNNSNESIAMLQRNVQAYLQSKGFEQPNILFTSALAAKLVQSEANGQALTRKERNQLRFFEDILLDPAYDLTQYAIYNKQQVSSPIYFNGNLTDDQKKLLIHSGMTEVLNCL